MSLNLLRNREPSFQQSRVSSSSSNSSQCYELIPREQPYFNPTRDQPAPKVSFPFRKVQAGNESMGSRSVNDSRSSIKGSAKDEYQSKDIIDVMGELNNSNKEIQRQRESMRNSISHEDCQIKIREANKKIEELQKQLEEQRYQFDLQRKANEIYIQNFSKIRELILSKQKILEGESMQEMVQKLAQLLQTKEIIDPSNAYHIIEEQDKKIRQLRAELLKSTQNNINAIFNTEITEAYLLQSQIQKMNVEISNLKEKLIKATTDSQENFARILQNNSNSPQVKKIIKYVKLNWDSDSDEEQISKKINRNRKESKKHLKQSRQRSSSEKSKRHMQLISTDNKINDLIEGYKALKDEYSKLGAMLSQINGSQTDWQQFFSILKKEIAILIQNHLKQRAQRPSSSHQQLRITRQLETKLNDLVNTLNAPEKVTVERQLEEEDNNNWKNVETVRKLVEVETKNMQLQQEVKKLSQERDYLQETIMKTFVNKPPQYSNI